MHVKLVNNLNSMLIRISTSTSNTKIFKINSTRNEIDIASF